MRLPHPVYRKIYRFGRYSKVMSLPADFMRRNGFDDCDEVEIQEQEDGRMLVTFLKPQEEVAE